MENNEHAKALTDEQIIRTAEANGLQLVVGVARNHITVDGRKVIDTVRALLASQPSAAWVSESRSDALCDMHYTHGLEQGFMYGERGDYEGFLKSQKSREGYIKTLKATRYERPQPTAPANVAAVRDANPSKIEITLTGDRIKQLLELCSPDHEADPQQLESEMTLVVGDGHSGHGLYAYWTDYPEEGAVAMFDAGTDGDDDAAPTAQPQADGVVK